MLAAELAYGVGVVKGSSILVGVALGMYMHETTMNSIVSQGALIKMREKIKRKKSLKLGQ